MEVHHGAYFGPGQGCLPLIDVPYTEHHVNCLRFANPAEPPTKVCEHGSDRRETSANGVSDDLQLSIFSRQNFFFEFFFENFSIFFSVFRNFRQILEELGFF